MPSWQRPHSPPSPRDRAPSPRTNFSTPTAGSIEVQPAGGGAGIAGVIDETTGEVYFPIPKKEREKYDITSLMVRAEVEYDTFITPSLTGLKDLSDRDNPFTITLTAGDKGTRTYTLWAFYTRR